ncbi:hypothetical protein BGX28_000487 [Mortierella sp. GBA30]|nr:hypothetical protein BGX28_000487 [Mortierella sp. GBA30]
MSKNPVNKHRKLGAIVAYTTLACGLASLGLYIYRQKQKNVRSNHNGSNNTRSSSSPDHTGLDHSNGQDDTRSSEAQSSSLARLGSKLARTVKRNRRVMTISLKNTIVWNPSPDPTTPNYGFVEGAIPLLFHLAENYNLHLILLCPSLQPQPQRQQHGKGPVLTIQEQDEIKQQQQLGQEREREQILTMLRNAGLISPVGTRGPKLIDPRQLLICETEEGVSHVVRHLESQVHVEALQNVVELVQGVVPKVVFVQKRPGHSRASSIAKEQQQNNRSSEAMTRSHIRVRANSGSSSSGSGGEEIRDQGINGSSTTSSSSQPMGDSFVEIVRNPVRTHEPLVSGYVTQAGKRGYVEVTDQLMHSSINPENSSK